MAARSSTDFFPLDVTNFGPTIPKIQAAKPDFVMVGAGRWRAHLLLPPVGGRGHEARIPMASTTFARRQRAHRAVAGGTNGILVCYNYFQDLESPANKAFLERFHKRFGADYPNITELAMGTYQGFQSLGGARQARPVSIDRMKVIEALETGISYRWPGGQGHHRPGDPSLRARRPHRRGRGTRSSRCSKTSPSSKPADTSAVCDLMKNPDDNQQYVIKI